MQCLPFRPRQHGRIDALGNKETASPILGDTLPGSSVIIIGVGAILGAAIAHVRQDMTSEIRPFGLPHARFTQLHQLKTLSMDALLNVAVLEVDCASFTRSFTQK